MTRRAGEVRLIGGRWKRSRLPVADRPGLRPTPDRVRETLFNWLGQDLTGWRVLDAFAGTGALGFEAASRGAQVVTMLERDAAQARALGATRQRLAADQVRVLAADTLVWMATAPDASFDLVLLDPPFDSLLHAPALAQAERLVAPGGFVYLEAASPWGPPPALVPWREMKAGAVHAHLWRRPA